MILPQEYEYNDEDVFYATYEEKENMFYYDGGYVNHLIYDILTPNELYIFLKNRDDVVIKTKSGDLYVVYYNKDEVN